MKVYVEKRGFSFTCITHLFRARRFGGPSSHHQVRYTTSEGKSYFFYVYRVITLTKESSAILWSYEQIESKLRPKPSPEGIFHMISVFGSVSRSFHRPNGSTILKVDMPSFAIVAHCSVKFLHNRIKEFVNNFADMYSIWGTIWPLNAPSPQKHWLGQKFQEDHFS